MHSDTSYVCASKFSLCAVHVNVSHVYTEYIGGGAINASVHPFSCLHTNTMKVRICRQDGKSELQTLGGITRNITHSGPVLRTTLSELAG